MGKTENNLSSTSKQPVHHDLQISIVLWKNLNKHRITKKDGLTSQEKMVNKFIANCQSHTSLCIIISVHPSSFDHQYNMETFESQINTSSVENNSTLTSQYPSQNESHLTDRSLLLIMNKKIDTILSELADTKPNLVYLKPNHQKNYIK